MVVDCWLKEEDGRGCCLHLVVDGVAFMICFHDMHPSKNDAGTISNNVVRHQHRLYNYMIKCLTK
jgi:hypothetical protein